MKTSVNLYSAEFQPSLRLMSLSLVILLCLISALLISSLYLYDLTQEQQQQQTLNDIEQQKKQQTMLLKTLQADLVNLKKDPALLQQIDNQQATLALKKRVLQTLLGQEDLKSNGFSALMSELANNHPKGLWLTHIGLNGTEVILEGAASQSSVIPQWVDSLGETQYFKGQEFSETRLYRNAEQQLMFVISTAKSESPAQKGG